MNDSQTPLFLGAGRQEIHTRLPHPVQLSSSEPQVAAGGSKMIRLKSAAAACAVVLLASNVSAQPTTAPAASIVPATLHIPEGTELAVTFKDSISSATSVVGDIFTISLDDPVTLPNGGILPGGLTGAGEVTSVHKKGMMGKAGDLNVRLNYLKLGPTKIRLRGSKGSEGEAKLGTTVVLTVLFGPLGLLKHGHDVTIESGQKLKAYVDQDIDVPLPASAAAAAAPASVSAAH